MKVALVALSTLSLVANSLASASYAAEYPKGSLARRLADERWGEGSFGGIVGSQEWPSGRSPKENNIDSDSEEEEDITTTITKTAVVTVTRTRSHTAAPTPPARKAKRSQAEDSWISQAPLTSAEEAAFLNDIFTLDLFKAGSKCNSEVQRHVCAGHNVLVCSSSHNVWEVKENCGAKSLKCGAVGAQDGSGDVHVMCIAGSMVELPEDRPSDRIRDDINADLKK